MSFPLFIARKIRTTSESGGKTGSTAVRIATAGIAIGLAVMIVTVSVVIGFKNTVRSKVTGFGSHIQVMNFLAQKGIDPYPICVDDSMMARMAQIEGIANVQRYAMAQGILKTDADYMAMAFKGVGPEYDLAFIRSCMKAGECPTFSDDLSSNKIVISQSVADKLQTDVGDRIFAYFVGENEVRTRRFTICGIYETNMSRFDDNVCLTDLYTACRLNGWTDGDVSGAELLVTDFNELQTTMRKVIKAVNRDRDRHGNTLTSQTIYEAYPQVFSWLDLLDINVYVILVLMICVAGFTMIAGLLIIILERTQMIGTLKALGARNSTVRSIFLWLATFIIGRGMIIGDIIGIALVVLQKTTGLVQLDAQTYYVSEVPVELHIMPFAGLNIATLVICVLVLVGPTYIVAHIRPAQVMKYE